MPDLVKFIGPDFDQTQKFVYPNVWERERLKGTARLRIGLREGEIETILDLCSALRGPFGVLYVLVVSRLGREAGRYQNPYPVEHEDLAVFLRTYKEFIEQDGRHHLWVSDVSSEGQLVFDRHNLIYAYGPLEGYRSKLETRGVTEGSVRVPSPHGHEYHGEFDGAEDALMSHWAWLHFPLRPGDDE